MRRAPIVLLGAATVAAIAVLECSNSAGQPRTFPPRLSVLPRVAKVFAGSDLQFHTALVGGSQATGVTWTVVGPGTIDRDGLYHSPAVAATADVVADAGDGVTDSVAVTTVRPPAVQRPTVLSTCYEDGTVNVFDAHDRTLAGAFSTGGHAAGIAVDATTRRAVFAVDTQLVVVDLATMRWRASAPLAGARFSEVATLAFGYFAATDNLAEPDTPGVRLFRINPAGVPVFVSSVRAGETPEGIAAADNGRTFYVTAINSNAVMRFSVDPHGIARATGSARTATRPFGVAVDPIHHLLFVADNDTATLNGSRANPGLERFALPSMHRIGTVVSTGSKAALPLGVAVDPSTSRLFVTNEGLSNVAVFSIPQLRHIATLPAALTPWLPYLDALHHRLYVPNARADSISIFDTRTLRSVAAPLPTCAYPTSVAVFSGAS